MLNKNTPFDLVYNDKSAEFIDRYLGVDKPLIERMQQLKKLYFPIFETILDQYKPDTTHHYTQPLSRRPPGSKDIIPGRD